MMKAVLDKSVIQRIINHVKVVEYDRLCVEYNPDGWKIRSTDPAHVAMVEILVGKSAMGNYTLEDDGINQSVIPLKRLSDAIDTMPDDSPITITDNLDGFRLDCGKFHRKIRKDGEFNQPKVPDLNLPCEFDIDTSEFSRMMSKGANISDHFEINCTPEGLFITVSSDMDEAVYENPEIRSGDGRSYCSMFPLDYMNTALRGINGVINVEIGNDYPLIIASSTPFTTRYLLAPRIESQEDEL